jgi:hypothetical protein
VAARRVSPCPAYGCRLVQVVDELWLCPHTARGPATKLGDDVVAEARKELEDRGGYAAALERLEREEEARRELARIRAQRSVRPNQA